MNDDIIKILSELAQIAEIRGDAYRSQAYRNAILSIQKLDYPINTLANTSIEGVGKNIRKKLIEYAQTGQVAELIALKNSSDVIAYRELSRIAGVGPKTIATWLRAGITNLQSLRREMAAGRIELNNVQKYGLMFYEDLNLRIPRSEVEYIGNYICGQIHSIAPCECAIVGSYRRELPDSGDIDIITSGEYSLRDLMRLLAHDPNFIDTFSIGSERFTFIYRSRSGKVRQIDVLNLPRKQYWSGLLYFTGSWEFNAAMRGTAKARGYLLNQRGLFKLRGTKSINVQSERDIFDIIGIRYVEPKDRTGSDKIVLK